MRQIDHFISGGAGASSVRFGDIMDLNNGGVQARVGLGDAAGDAIADDENSGARKKHRGE
jgi:hypothetical protein